MKKAVSVILSLCIVIGMSFFAVGADDEKNPTAVSAEAYVLYCVENGSVVSSKNENRRMKPASTTKLMTTLLTLEEAEKADKIATFTKDMIAEGSSMYLELGDKVRLSDLATGMMMSSGNDAANAAAITISGSFENFAKLMNSRAKEFKMENTNFVTPSGLDDDNHYSTAYDMALLMAGAMQNENFARLTAKKSKKVDFVSPEKHITYSNHNRLLSLYEYCVGGKTGYTESAGRCLVSVARKNGLTLVCVTMNDRKDWDDHIALYNYGFDSLSCKSFNDSELCEEIPCVGSETDSISVAGESDTKLVLSPDEAEKVERRVYIDSFLYAPIEENDAVGVIEYSIDGRVIKKTRILAVQSAERQRDKSIIKKIKGLLNG